MWFPSALAKSFSERRQAYPDGRRGPGRSRRRRARCVPRQCGRSAGSGWQSRCAPWGGARHAVAGLEGRLLRLVFLVLRRALDGSAARRVPARGGELERDALSQREQRLNQPLAEGRRPHDDRPVMVLQCAGDDLRGARRAIVHQRDDRQLWPRLARLVVELLGGPPCTAAGRNDLLLRVEEEIGDLDALIEQSAGVHPQVQDERLHALGLHRADLGLQLVGGRLGHGIERDVSDAAVEHRARRHRADMDLGPGEGILDRIGDAGPADGDRHLEPASPRSAFTASSFFQPRWTCRPLR